MRTEHLLNGPNHTFIDPLPISEYIDKKLIEQNKTKLGFNQIYVINLDRRSDRKKRMSHTLDALDISYKIVSAVDGKQLTSSDLLNLGIEILPNYKDPYLKRSLTFGEIGCFLSHFYIWEEVSLKEVERFFKSKNMNSNANLSNPYLILVKPGYSVWLNQSLEFF